MTKKLIFSMIALLMGFSSMPILAAEFEVTIYNLTPGQPFSPPVLAAHTGVFNIAGQKATPGITLLAEDGDSSTLLIELAFLPNVSSVVSASGPIPPGGSATLTINADSPFDYLSAVGMLVNTNDAFFALINQEFPDSDTVATPTAAWDAGTEVNDEACSNIPGPACGGSPGAGTPEDGVIVISNGIHGSGDLSSSSYDWRNPVALIVVTRK